ncbi:MAG: Asp23/Gls24 family envelope stress response protein, partial [Eggerthellaceae bacterium]|nr:Asp23/Gls24 family envelope stress response protein [Eggerthellaceae bacterium]
ANEVDGVASVGSYTTSSIRSMLAAKPSSAGIGVDVDDDGRLRITVHIEVYYGYVLPEVAAALRQSVADALLVQVGLEAASVDIFVDGMQFAA